MTEQDLRALVRETLARRLGQPATALPPVQNSALMGDPRRHVSHGRLSMAPSVQQGQPCVIEPDVPCALCGYCQSVGH